MPLPVARALALATEPGGDLDTLRLTDVISLVDIGTFENDLLGDDLLVERGLEPTEDDSRSVGEALAAQVGHADVLIVHGSAHSHPVGSDLVDHIRSTDSLRIDGLHTIAIHRDICRTHDAEAAEHRLDPMHARAGTGPTGNGVWSLELHSLRPFHPERLVDQIERLGTGRHRSRGIFWVANRPYSACAWDGAGGQLSIGEIGRWGNRTPTTRLVYTGTGHEAPDLRAAFRDILLSDNETRTGMSVWLACQDVLAPWLGDRTSTW